MVDFVMFVSGIEQLLAVNVMVLILDGNYE